VSAHRLLAVAVGIVCACSSAGPRDIGSATAGLAHQALVDEGKVRSAASFVHHWADEWNVGFGVVADDIPSFLAAMHQTGFCEDRPLANARVRFARVAVTWTSRNGPGVPGLADRAAGLAQQVRGRPGR
jgi:hypothetical protein